MPMTRRKFLGQAAGAAAATAALPRLVSARPSPRASAPRARKELKLLILGGTGLLGPQVIESARARGHQIAMFNRGRTAPGLFPDVEHLEGDRYGDLESLREQVAAGRKWDAVIDTFTYVPQTVTDAMDVLMPAMGQFVVISTISVYASQSQPGMDETGALAQVPDDVAAGITTHREVGQHYGAMKARCEAAAEDRMPGRVTNIRPGLIVGPRDTTGRFSYWPIRATEGGTMIAPGDGSHFSQFIDSRDLGEFVVTCCEQRHVGVFNADRPAASTTMRDVVAACLEASPEAGTNAEWIPADFLAEQGVAAWQELPAWIPPEGEYAGFGQVSTAKAIAAGLGTRPLADTVRACLDYYRSRGAELEAERGAEFIAGWRRQIRGGLAPEKEQAVLEAWRARGATSAP